jgi:branched-chain amino acid aminotransferase
VFANVNGQLTATESATVSIYDRGFLYGDGVFETLRFANGRCAAWAGHWERFHSGAQFLGIALPGSEQKIVAQIQELLTANHRANALVRIQLTRGPGPRGYSPAHAGPATLVITCHQAPVLPEAEPHSIPVVVSQIAIPAGDPLSAFKTCNRLHNTLARAQADAAGADEALMLNSQGCIACASAANVFCIVGERLLTPSLNAGALPGVTRRFVLRQAGALGLTVMETDLTTADLLNAQGAFLTQSSRGIVEVSSLNGRPLAKSPLTARLFQTWRKHLTSP